mgnify:CR=1 FL=1
MQWYSFEGRIVYKELMYNNISAVELLSNERKWETIFIQNHIIWANIGVFNGAKELPVFFEDENLLI